MKSHYMGGDKGRVGGPLDRMSHTAGGGAMRRDAKYKDSSPRARPTESPRSRAEVSPRGMSQLAPGSSRQEPLQKDGGGRPGPYYSPDRDRRKSASARPRQLPQPGEAPRRKSEVERTGYQSASLGSGRSPGRSGEGGEAKLRNHIRKDSSPGGGRAGPAGVGDVSPSRRSEDGEEYRTPPDRSPNLSRQHQDFHKTAAIPDRSPPYFQGDKSPNREDVYRTPPDRSPNRSSAYHRSPVDGSPRSPRDRSPREPAESGHRHEGSDSHRRKDTSPGRSAPGAAPAPDSKEPRTLHPHDQPTSHPNYPASQAGRRRSSSGQRLERQAAIVRERIEMHPDEISLGGGAGSGSGSGGGDAKLPGTSFSFSFHGFLFHVFHSLPLDAVVFSKPLGPVCDRGEDVSSALTR